MTPAAVELALEIRRETEARHQEADRLRSRTVERAQQTADLAQRRFMMVDPGNRLVADTLEREWNDKLRSLAQAQEAREQSRQQDRLVIDGAIRRRLAAMTGDFKTIWTDPNTPNRERKRLLAYVIEDATLIKQSKDITTIHVRFKGGKTEALTAQNPKSFAQQLKTSRQVVALVDKLLDEHTYPEIADQLNAQGFRPAGRIRPGCVRKLLPNGHRPIVDSLTLSALSRRMGRERVFNGQSFRWNPNSHSARRPVVPDTIRYEGHRYGSFCVIHIVRKLKAARENRDTFEEIGAVLCGEVEIFREVCTEGAPHFAREILLFQAVNDRPSRQRREVFVFFEPGGHRHTLDLHFQLQLDRVATRPLPLNR